MSFNVDDLQNAFDTGRNLAPQAVVSQVLIMSAASIVTVLLFNFLRPKNKIVYEPRVKYHEENKKPPAISDSLFGWLPPLIHTKEPQLLEKIGLDAVTFLRFLKLLRTLFTGITLLTCGILLPINVLYNLDKVNPKKRDVLSMTTIRDVKGERLYVHVAISYLITIFTVVLVYIFWKDMVKLRNDWFRSPEYIQAFYARTLSVTHVPKKFQDDQGITTILQSAGLPYAPTSVHISRKVGKLPELIKYHNETVREFEAVLVKYLKGGRIGKYRPTVRIGGFMGLGGVKQDAIDFYTKKLKRTEAAVHELRRTTMARKAENYGFASFGNVPYAHACAVRTKYQHPKGTTISLAPNPKDIIWENMSRSDAELARRQVIGWVWLTIICFLSLIPLLLVAVLANLDGVAAAGYLPFLSKWSASSSISFSIVSGVVPPLLSVIFTFFFPKIMRWLSQFQGALTHARLDRAVVARYFAFLVISQLIIFTLLGVVFNSVTELVVLVGKHASKKQILANLNKLPDRINKTYINQASYWLKFFPLRGFLVVFDLAQILNLVWISIKTRLFGRTPRDIRAWTQPPIFEYAIYYANLLFLASVAYLFAPLAPLVPLAAAIVFWISSWVYKYQLMYVFVTKVETGGRIWNVLINRLLSCVILMQLLMILTIGLQSKFRSLTWISTVPPILIVIIFKLYIKSKFNRNFNYYIPTVEELTNIKVHSGRGDVRGNRLEYRFGHPSLHADLFTPMVHSKMLPLLARVYQGKISDEKAKVQLNEYGGQNVDARVLEGITIAAVDQHDLEYDAQLYQRDRGDMDRWSLASSTMLGPRSPSVLSPTQTVYQPTPGNYDAYLANGPGQYPNSFPPMQQPAAYFDQSHHGPLRHSTMSPVSMYSQPSTVASVRPPSQVMSWYSAGNSPLDSQHQPHPGTHVQGPSHHNRSPSQGSMAQHMQPHGQLIPQGAARPASQGSNPPSLYRPPSQTSVTHYSPQPYNQYAPQPQHPPSGAPFQGYSNV